MSTKQKFLSAYFFVALLFGTYGWLFGQFKYKGFFYNLGKGVIWPVTIFPALGAIIGGIIIVLFVTAIILFGKNNNN